MGTINTVAGGVGGPGRATTVSLRPCGVTFAGGSIYVADGAAVRKISQTGQLTTPAGTGVQGGPSDNGGLATKADLLTCGMAVDHAGNLVLSDPSLRQIGVVAATNGTFYGQAMTKGNIYTVAGGGAGFTGDGGPATRAGLVGTNGVAVDGNGDLLISDSNRVQMVTG